MFSRCLFRTRFKTPFKFEKFEDDFARLRDGNFEIFERNRLSVNQAGLEETALNDVVVHRGLQQGLLKLLDRVKNPDSI